MNSAAIRLLLFFIVHIIGTFINVKILEKLGCFEELIKNRNEDCMTPSDLVIICFFWEVSAPLVLLALGYDRLNEYYKDKYKNGE